MEWERYRVGAVCSPQGNLEEAYGASPGEALDGIETEEWGKHCEFGNVGERVKRKDPRPANEEASPWANEPLLRLSPRASHQHMPPDDNLRERWSEAAIPYLPGFPPAASSTNPLPNISISKHVFVSECFAMSELSVSWWVFRGRTSQSWQRQAIKAKRGCQADHTSAPFVGRETRIQPARLHSCAHSVVWTDLHVRGAP